MKKTILAFILGLACASPAHEHHNAPHGGDLIELGDEFANLELVLDSESGKLNAYVFDGEVESPLRLAQKSLHLDIRTGTGKALSLDLKAIANPLSGETAGDSSEFSTLSKSLTGLKSFKGKLRQVVVHGEIFRNINFQYPVPIEK